MESLWECNCARWGLEISNESPQTPWPLTISEDNKQFQRITKHNQNINENSNEYNSNTSDNEFDNDDDSNDDDNNNNDDDDANITTTTTTA